MSETDNIIANLGQVDITTDNLGVDHITFPDPSGPVITASTVDVMEAVLSDNTSDSQIPVGEGIIAQVRDPEDEATDESESDLEVFTEDEPVREEIPQNILEGKLNHNTSRFSSADWFDVVQDKHVLLLGIGGIGSWTGLLLSRLNLDSIVAYDSDTVDDTNMSGQLYRREDIGKYKVNALKGVINSFSRYYKFTSFSNNYAEDSLVYDITICGFDNMEARKIAFTKWKNRVLSKSNLAEKAECLFIDGRMAAETFQIFAIKGDDSDNMKLYEEKYLFDDSEADATICSYKQTSFCASMIASFIVNIFVNFCTNQCNPLLEREVPFFTEYTADIMYLTQKR